MISGPLKLPGPEVESWPRVTEIINSTIADDPKMIDAIVKKERKGIDTRKALKKAGKLGTNYHKYLGSVLEGEEVSVPEKMIKPIEQGKTLLESLYNYGSREVFLWDDSLIPHRGTLDLIMTSKENGETVLIDIKTGRPKFMFTVSGWEVIPRPKHIIQLHAYKFLYERLFGKTIDKMFIFQLYNKEFKLLPVGYREGLWESVLQVYQVMCGR